MKSPSESTTEVLFTREGLPISHAIIGAVSNTSDAGHGGPTRRVDVASSSAFALSQPTTAFLNSPGDVDLSSDALTSTSLSKNINAELAPPSLHVPSRRHLRESPFRSSLMDDDDEELFDPFSDSKSTIAAPVPLAASIDLMDSEDEDVTSARRWLVRDDNVPTLPCFYPLDKSAVFIPHASAPVIADRIQTVLRRRSIVTEYYSKNARVECTSATNVDFNIRLYKGRGDFKHGIIVEVQRRDGFDLTYQKDVFAILDAAEGKATDHNLDESPIFFEGEDDQWDQSFTSLRIISDVLCSDKPQMETIDGANFALTSLASLTNVDRMGQAALQLSRELLSSQECAVLRQAVFSNVGSPLVFSRRHMLKSLEILANVSLSTRGSKLLFDLASANESDILIKLIGNIENAVKEPRAADLSCVILKHICDNASALQKIESLHGERLRPALMGAVSHGSNCHADLELHSNLCLCMISL